MLKMSNLALAVTVALLNIVVALSGEGHVSLWSCGTWDSTYPQCSVRGCYWRSWWKCWNNLTPLTNSKVLLSESVGKRLPFRSSSIYIEMLHRHCPWCDQDKLDKLLEEKEPDSLVEVAMCKSITSYALPKLVLNKEGVYNTVAADPNTKLVEAVRVSYSSKPG